MCFLVRLYLQVHLYGGVCISLTDIFLNGVHRHIFEWGFLNGDYGVVGQRASGFLFWVGVSKLYHRAFFVAKNL